MWLQKESDYERFFSLSDRCGISSVISIIATVFLTQQHANDGLFAGVKVFHLNP